MKKLIAVLLVLSLILGAMAGCSDKNSGDEDIDPKTVEVYYGAPASKKVRKLITVKRR